jgi:hypothetical protein
MDEMITYIFESLKKQHSFNKDTYNILLKHNKKIKKLGVGMIFGAALAVVQDREIKALRSEVKSLKNEVKEIKRDMEGD